MAEDKIFDAPQTENGKGADVIPLRKRLAQIGLIVGIAYQVVLLFVFGIIPFPEVIGNILGMGILEDITVIIILLMMAITYILGIGLKDFIKLSGKMAKFFFLIPIIPINFLLGLGAVMFSFIFAIYVPIIFVIYHYWRISEIY